MTRHLVIALIVVIAVFGAGFVLRDALFPERASQPVLLSSAGSGAERTLQLTVRRVEGLVERRQGDGGTWQPLTPDSAVSERDSVRTDEGASAVLAGEGGLQIELAEQSQLAMVALKGEKAELVVERGRVAAAVDKAAGTLRVGSRDSDTWVEATQSTFCVLRDGAGKLAVAVTEGDVAVTSQQKRVQVNAGEQSVVPVHQPPEKPVRIPPSLFLKVSRSGPSRVNQRSTELSGLTTPGAAVYVNGTPVPTDDSGSFVAKVPLQEGRNKLHVSVRDVLGRREHAELPEVTVDTRPPKLKGKTVW